MKHRMLFTAIFALPAAAGIVLFAGCDDNEAEPDYGDTSGGGSPGTGSASSDTLPDGNADNGVADQMTDAMKEKISQAAEGLQESSEAAKDEAKEAGDEAKVTMLGTVNELADKVQAAVGEGKMTEAAAALKQLTDMKSQLPQNVQDSLTKLVEAMPSTSGLIDGARGMLGGSGDGGDN